MRSIWLALNESYSQFEDISFDGSMYTIADVNPPLDWFTWLVAGRILGDERISSEELMNDLSYNWKALLKEQIACVSPNGYLAIDVASRYRPTN